MCNIQKLRRHNFFPNFLLNIIGRNDCYSPISFKIWAGTCLNPQPYLYLWACCLLCLLLLALTYNNYVQFSTFTSQAQPDENQAEQNYHLYYLVSQDPSFLYYGDIASLLFEKQASQISAAQLSEKLPFTLHRDRIEKIR